MRKWTRMRKIMEEEPYKLIKAFEDGMTIAQICHMLGISRQTYYNWLKSKEDFYDMVQIGQGRQPGRVVDALYKLALGYEFEERVTEDRNGSPYTKVVKKHQPPYFKAVEYILSNRMAKFWSSGDEAGGDQQQKLIDLARAIKEGNK